MKFLCISEYSDYGIIPNRKNYEYELKLGDRHIRSFVFSGDKDKEQVKESINDPLFNEAKISSDVIPLDKVIIYDNKNLVPNNPDQKIAYVYVCPICLTTLISNDNDLDFCPHCENTKFSPELKALVNMDQMEDIAIEESDSSLLIIKKDNIEIIDNPNIINNSDDKKWWNNI